MFMTKKKNVIWMFLLALVTGTGLVACSDDDDDKGGATEVYVEEPGTLSKLLGIDVPKDAEGGVLYDILDRCE